MLFSFLRHHCIRWWYNLAGLLRSGEFTIPGNISEIHSSLLSLRYIRGFHPPRYQFDMCAFFVLKAWLLICCWTKLREISPKFFPVCHYCVPSEDFTALSICRVLFSCLGHGCMCWWCNLAGRHRNLLALHLRIPSTALPIWQVFFLFLRHGCWSVIGLSSKRYPRNFLSFLRISSTTLPIWYVCSFRP